MNCADVLQTLQIIQIAALLVIGHVSIGIYGSYYLLKSLAEQSPELLPNGAHVAVVTHDTSDGVPQVYDFPPSARGVPFIGLVLSGLLGIILVIALIFVLIPLGFIFNKIRMIIIRCYLSPLARWAPRQRSGHVCMRRAWYSSETCTCGHKTEREVVHQGHRFPKCANCRAPVNWYWDRDL